MTIVARMHITSSVFWKGNSACPAVALGVRTRTTDDRSRSERHAERQSSNRGRKVLADMSPSAGHTTQETHAE